MPADATVPLDRRRNAFREDLAAEDLRGRVSAAQFVEGVRKVVIAASVPMRDQPRSDLGYSTELLLGEAVREFETKEGWSWVQAERDRYVGYVPTDALGAMNIEPDHRVSALGTAVYARADIKSPPVMHLSINARVMVIGQSEQMSQIAPDGWVVSRHLHDRSRFARDYVEIAERFIGTPYLWGGRTRVGLDCSGLVQTAMEAAGLECPRDSDMQRAEIGSGVSIRSDLEGLQRGDLVFWAGHVGIMVDAFTLLHANAHHMSVVAELLTETTTRIGKTGSKIAAIRRPKRLAAPLRS